MTEKELNLEGDDFMSNHHEKLETVETCKGPSLEDCCFGCDSYDICNREGKCGGEYFKDSHGDCDAFNDYRCPHNPEYILPKMGEVT